MKILQVLPALESGGVERGTIEIAQALQAAGHTALVASAGGKMVGELEACGAQHFTLPLRTRNPITAILNVFRLRRLIVREQVMLVHARSRMPAWSAYFAARLAKVPFITTFHGAYSLGLPGKRLYNSVMAKGQVVIAISRYIHNHITQHYGTPAARLRLIQRGFDEARFNPALVKPEEVAALRTRYGLRADVPTILYPGRITPVKGIDLILEALSGLQHLPWQFLVAGGDQGRSHTSAALKQQAQALGLQDRVIFTGDITINGAVMMLGDVIVSPRRTPEAFGRTLVEAQAMERLVITSDDGGAVETLQPGVTGWLVKPGEAQGIREALLAFFALPPDERARREAAARAFVLAHYTTARMCAQTLALYQEVLGMEKAA